MAISSSLALKSLDFLKSEEIPDTADLGPFQKKTFFKYEKNTVTCRKVLLNKMILRSRVVRNSKLGIEPKI